MLIKVNTKKTITIFLRVLKNWLKSPVSMSPTDIPK